eukprot:GEMP01002212.1.p1 GENE.GEMP01002212.1~~GEMP01002212.1.p1  ORF type:complete len:1097 (+),score=281.47 GEMP01002212.1:490-3291(+)
MTSQLVAVTHEPSAEDGHGDQDVDDGADARYEAMYAEIPVEEKRKGAPGARSVDKLLMQFGELTMREEQKKLQHRPERNLHGLTIDPDFNLTKGGVPDGWLQHEPCEMDYSKCKIPPLVCEGGIRIEWHYMEMMPPQKMVAFAVARAIRSAKHATLESPTGTGKTGALLCASLAAQRYISSKTGACPQILYGTRTQGQVKQVVRELRNSPFRPSVACLGSREKGLCINKAVLKASRMKGDLRTLCSDARKNHMVTLGKGSKKDPKKPSCDKVAALEGAFPHQVFPVMRPMYGDSDAAKEGRILDLEDLADLVGRFKGCPYFVSQISAVSSDIVVCPYNYILDPVAAKKSRVEIKNRIIILDEAHNIEQVCRDAGSCEIPLRMFRGDDSPLTNIKVHAKMLLPANMEITGTTGGDESHQTNLVLWQVEKFFEKISDKMRSWETTFVGKRDLKEEADRYNYDKRHRWEVHSWSPQQARPEYFIESLQWKRQNSVPKSGEITDPLRVAAAIEGLRKLLAAEPTGKIPENIIAKVRSSFDELAEVADGLARMWEHIKYYAITFAVALGKSQFERYDCMLNLYLLAPSVIFEEIAKSSHCVILSSGTLCPAESFFSELGENFGKNQIVGKFAGRILSPLEADHVVEPNQLFLQKISSVMVNSREMRFTNIQREIRKNGQWDDDILCGLGRSLVKLLEAIPEGVLVFFPSYTMLGKVEALWQSPRSKAQYQNTVWEALLRAKGTIVVEESSKDIEELKEEYLGCIATTNQGLLLGVLRAKCSEGISFNDANARAVIVIGISYPEIFSPEVRLKREFNDFLVKNNKSPLSGHAWYQQQAFRAINQALGRCIRHRDDYGALFIIDARWSEEPATEQKLANWLRKFGFRPACPVDQILEPLKDHFRLLRKKRGAEGSLCDCKKSLFGSRYCPQHGEFQNTLD